MLTICCRVKLPKTFLAVNLSEAFDFEGNDKLLVDDLPLEMRPPSPKEPLVLDMTDTVPPAIGQPELEDGGETPKPKTDAV